MTQEQNVIQWVYASKNEEELRERYDQWAKTYESDLDKDIGWYGPLVISLTQFFLVFGCVDPLDYVLSLSHLRFSWLIDSS